MKFDKYTYPDLSGKYETIVEVYLWKFFFMCWYGGSSSGFTIRTPWGVLVSSSRETFSDRHFGRKKILGHYWRAWRIIKIKKERV